ncbi:MAG: AEC family transporter [Prevotellaceae bacterium]|jgi:predicted permease|nr:AEC family transporter [Prevotellaceae bacterium]
MTNLFLIFFCIAIGVVFSRLHIVPESAHKSVNAWVLYVALPALSLRFVPEIKFSSDLWLPVIAPFVVWGGSWLFVHLYDYKKRLSVGSRTALFVICGLGNTGFIGIPMVTAYFGEAEVHHAVIFDQITFFIFATLGVITVMRATSEEAGHVNFYDVFRRLLRFPPLIASLVALVLPQFVDISFANSFFDKLVATMSPMALFSIGLQLRLGKLRQEWRLLTAGIAYKLILAPALVLILALVMGASGNLAKVSVFEAAMSSHITASILVSQSNLNPNYCSLVVGLGIVLGFITSAVWYFVVQGVF